MDSDRELRDYLFGLWAEKWLILAVFVGTVAVVAAVTLLLLPDRYESKASLLIMPPVANQLGADQRLEVDGSGTLRLREEGQLATLLNPRAYERLAQADDLIQTIIQDLELRQSPNNESPELMAVNALKRRVEVDAFPGGQARSGDPRSVWLTVRVRGQDPAQVRRIADAWAQRVIDRHREIADAAAQRAHDLIKRRLADVKETLKTKRRNKNDYLQDHSRSLLKAELDGLLNVYRSRWERSRSTDSDRQTNTGQDEVQTASQMRSLRQAIRKRDAELADVRATVAQLDRDIEAARQAYRTLTKRLQQVKLAQADRTPSIEMVERPIEPDAPTSSRATIYLIIAAVLGLLLGLFVASFKRYVLHPATAEPRTEADQSATTEGD